ncbi:nucleotide exchange factor SIL1 [Lethenteron reissneri]|uniref:nucleotide exchange factor SIL1 n=1 Tax=Lethenteron reissneri TaxID=7753 RepID=UPI002AB64057|nr:nucleotide exchange factor SIL1 [Lethenteron reissneri]
MRFGRFLTMGCSGRLSLLLLAVALCSTLNVRAKETSALVLVEENVEDGPEANDATVTTKMEQQEEEYNPEVFHPTSEWQSLKPGQAVPAGLHIRLNLQTGEREAKLLDEADGRNHGENKDDRKQRDKKGSLDVEAGSYTAAELKQALKKFKYSDPDAAAAKAHADEVKKNFRSMDEIKKDFNEMHVKAESDSQIMRKLLATFSQPDVPVTERSAALFDLEYYVHQVDNARDLATLGGLQKLVNALNSSEPEIRKNAAFVLGSAMSGNPPVQVQAVDGGILQKLVTALATEQQLPVTKKALYALAAALRHFPFAQQRFLSLGGLSALGRIFDGEGTRSLRFKVLTLIGDMLNEKSQLESTSGDETEQEQLWRAERLEQYRRMALAPALASLGWCDMAAPLLSDGDASPDHDSREKALAAVLALMPACRDAFLEPERSHALARRLALLRDEYRRLAWQEAAEGDADGYFAGMLNDVEKLAAEFDPATIASSD